MCSFFTYRHYPLLPPCLQFSFLPFLRATHFFSIFSSVLFQERLLNYSGINGCHAQWEHAPHSSLQICLAEEHCGFLRNRKEEGSLLLKQIWPQTENLAGFKFDTECCGMAKSASFSCSFSDCFCFCCDPTQKYHWNAFQLKKKKDFLMTWKFWWNCFHFHSFQKKKKARANFLNLWS